MILLVSHRLILITDMCWRFINLCFAPRLKAGECLTSARPEAIYTPRVAVHTFTGILDCANSLFRCLRLPRPALYDIQYCLPYVFLFSFTLAALADCLQAFQKQSDDKRTERKQRHLQDALHYPLKKRPELLDINVTSEEVRTFMPWLAPSRDSSEVNESSVDSNIIIRTDLIRGIDSISVSFESVRIMNCRWFVESRKYDSELQIDMNQKSMNH